MFLNMDISRLHRLAFIVARGHLSMAAALRSIDQLAQAAVPSFAKIIDLSGVTSDLGPGELRRLAAQMRRVSDLERGRMALLVDLERDLFGKRVTEVVGRHPHAAVFRSLHAARSFVRRELIAPAQEGSHAA